MSFESTDGVPLAAWWVSPTEDGPLRAAVRVERRGVEAGEVRRRRIGDGGADALLGAGGNAAQFINHSCQPNSFVRIMHGHIIFFALRDIRPGEEITMDYRDPNHPLVCKCGAPRCRSCGWAASGSTRSRAWTSWCRTCSIKTSNSNR